MLVSFINAFLSYLLLFAIIVILVVIACVLGVSLRKKKDAQAAVSTVTGEVSEGNGSAG